MAIKIEMLRCFSVVVQSGNLGEAAGRLGRTQSAVSMTLKQLEDHLGQRLFKTDRKSRLTPLGEQVFELAQNQLHQFDATIEAIETSARSPAGLVRVISVPSIAGIIFPTAAAKMSKTYPNLKIELRDADTTTVIDSLLTGQADLGIASGEHVLTGITRTPLFSDRFGLLCSPEHPLAKQDREPTINDVTSANFVRNNLCNHIETAAFHKSAARACITVHNTLSLTAMIRDSGWVTVLPQTVVKIMPKDLTFRTISDLPDKRDVNFYLHERSPFRAFAEDFQNICLQSIEQHGIRAELDEDAVLTN